ncbi:RICIN domain-containing protein [Amycolatopsis sp. NEAU-NG30]|uniref:RICIN domain-containing protein n=1 Tax=Amycolatopsis melonis TaxID=3156488 RepID=A0ABV0LMS2_9PSEU
MGPTIRRAAVALTAAATMTSLPAGTANAATYRELTNQKTDWRKCVSLAGGGSTANNTNLVIYTCTGGDEQQWAFEPAGDYYRIKNRKAGGGKCVSVGGGGGTAQGDPVILYTCNGGREQDWSTVAYGLGYLVVNRKSGYTWSLADGGSTANNTHIVQWRILDSAPEQVWRDPGAAPGRVWVV